MLVVTDRLQVFRELTGESIRICDRVILAPLLVRSNSVLYLLCQVWIDIELLQVLRHTINDTLASCGIHFHVVYNGAGRNCL